ncbi:hypothetical protein ACMD2_06229 [Ananas comosus]|uniref:Uncharacterized protein n=1 Tax=Ananas comosus TaxID=4615 RepID=A0A199UQF6_ANACO|nr:hypothetical protein ACMD2_06229 [Ananas comosus]
MSSSKGVLIHVDGYRQLRFMSAADMSGQDHTLCQEDKLKLDSSDCTDTARGRGLPSRWAQGFNLVLLRASAGQDCLESMKLEGKKFYKLRELHLVSHPTH